MISNRSTRAASGSGAPARPVASGLPALRGRAGFAEYPRWRPAFARSTRQSPAIPRFSISEVEKGSSLPQHSIVYRGGRVGAHAQRPCCHLFPALSTAISAESAPFRGELTAPSALSTSFFRSVYGHFGRVYTVSGRVYCPFGLVDTLFCPIRHPDGPCRQAFSPVSTPVFAVSTWFFVVSTPLGPCQHPFLLWIGSVNTERIGPVYSSGGSTDCSATFRLCCRFALRAALA